MDAISLAQAIIGVQTGLARQAIAIETLKAAAGIDAGVVQLAKQAADQATKAAESSAAAAHLVDIVV